MSERDLCRHIDQLPLSFDGRQLAFLLLANEGQSKGETFLRVMSKDPELGFDLNVALSELRVKHLLGENPVVVGSKPHYTLTRLFSKRD